MKKETEQWLEFLISKLQDGFSEGIFLGKKYGMNKTIYNNGSSMKFFAEELGGNDFVSLNLYLTSKGAVLKPCEMSEKKVKDFLSKIVLVSSN